jgi:hypothetical protein
MRKKQLRALLYLYKGTTQTMPEIHTLLKEREVRDSETKCHKGDGSKLGRIFASFHFLSVFIRSKRIFGKNEYLF